MNNIEKLNNDIGNTCNNCPFCNKLELDNKCHLFYMFPWPEDNANNEVEIKVFSFVDSNIVRMRPDFCKTNFKKAYKKRMQIEEEYKQATAKYFSNRSNIKDE